YTDYTFYTAYPSCYKIVRKWAAIDWCTYSPNDPTGEGIWEHTQLIWVFDTVPPVLNCPQQVEVGIDVNDCADYAQLPPVTADDCSQEVVIENDSPWADSDGADASGTYPKGTHTVTFTAWDGCGNSSTCTMTVVVRDALPPSPVCNNGVSVTIQPNGLVTITPDMVEGGSSDNCTPADQLILQVSPNTFTCQDIGTRTVTLSVTDQAGNTAFCQTQVVIQDNLGICPPSSPIASIGGQLATELGDPLPQMIVGLAGGVPIAIHTDLNGNYQFDNLPTGYSYTVVPAWNSDYDNGVTTFDMVLIRRHILGIQLLDSPYKMIAADVNRSNTITTVDMVHIRQLILHMTDKFPNNTSWRFIDADYEFPDPMNPWLEPFPEQITIGNLYENSWGNDFVGVKVGDVNGSALTQPAGGFAGESEDRTDRMLLLDIDDRMLVPGEEVEVTVSLAEALPLLALQGTCTFDAGALEWLGWQAGDMPSLSDDCWNTRHADEGWLALAWINEAEVPVQGPLWTWRFRAKRAVRLSDVL
ncbi:MAG: HYR domain-containing protein, partial [Bacteroidetes bacterium]